jgi:adenosylcobinamide-GDP ribazoletransferase
VRLVHDFWLALGFLTVLPVPATGYRPDGLGQAGRWFPAVGLLLGALLALAFAGLAALFPAPLVAVGVVAVWAVLTGGLHLDGLADCCDGLLAPVDRERRLAIMADPRLGAFAGIGLILALALKIAAVGALAVPWPALLLAPTWARWLILLAARQPSARPGGMGDAFRSGLTPAVWLWAAVVPLALTVAVAPTWRGLAAVIAAHAVALGTLAVARRRLGGVTGDVFGLVVELGELAILLTFAARV